MRISDWSSDVCSSDLQDEIGIGLDQALAQAVVDAGAAEQGRRFVGGGDARDHLRRHSKLRRLDRSRPAPSGPPQVRRSVAQPQRRFRVEPLPRSEEHTTELQSLMRNSYADFCLKKKKPQNL